MLDLPGDWFGDLKYDYIQLNDDARDSYDS